MKKISIYYDDNERSCKEYMHYFNQYDRVIAKKASQFSDKSLVFESENIVGFVFTSSENGLTDTIEHLLSKIVMDKKAKCFLVLSGGKKELGTLKQAIGALENRGYRVVRFVSPYIMKKKEIDTKKAIKDIMKNIDSADITVRISEIGESYKSRAKQSKPLRKRIRRELKEYFQYHRKHKKE